MLDPAAVSVLSATKKQIPHIYCTWQIKRFWLGFWLIPQENFSLREDEEEEEGEKKTTYRSLEWIIDGVSDE